MFFLVPALSTHCCVIALIDNKVRLSLRKLKFSEKSGNEAEEFVKKFS